MSQVPLPMTEESDPGPTPDSSPEDSGSYRVLARRHRPQDFDTLIGQAPMVRTLRNAFEANRIAHAFILNGIRGVGKTTTARILAKGLNCLGADGTGAPTVAPCGICDSCTAITESRHLDVIEIDAASHTGVDNIREIINNVRHRPNWARYKVYIIDEVHMLSTSAFNALLKTLEEPPPHVKFIFATTEIQKVPLTVLSRCQRFDLSRVDAATLAAHLRGIAGSEGAEIEDSALALITRAAEGSVRDGVSLLDQAIAHGGQPISADGIREMLALADRSRIFDLFEQICRGDAREALGETGSQIDNGADPVSILEGLAEVCHWVSVLRVAPDIASNPDIPPDEAKRGADFAEKLGPATLVRFWQILERSLAEVRRSGMPRLATDMTIIRLSHASTLPSPDDLVARLEDAGGTPQPVPGTRAAAPARIEKVAAPARIEGAAAPTRIEGAAAPTHIEGAAAPTRIEGAAAPTRIEGAAAPTRIEGAAAPTRIEGAAAPTRIEGATAPTRIEDVAALARMHRESRLTFDLENNLRVVEFTPGSIVYVAEKLASPTLMSDLTRALHEWTGQTWAVRQVPDGGGRTIAERAQEERDIVRKELAGHPEIQQVLEAFPGAEIEAVSPLTSRRLH